MRNRMRAQAILLLLLFSCLSLAQGTDAGLADGLRLLEEGRTTLEEKTLTDAKTSFTQLAQTSGNPAYFYQLARVDLYLANSYLDRHEKKLAERTIDEAIVAAQHSIELDDEAAAAHSLLADLYGRKIEFGGFLAGPRLGPKIDAENKRAFELAPNDARVFASLGRQYLHAPKMFGGNIDKAIDNFRKATQLDPNSDENFVWLAIAYRKNGDAVNAANAVQQALRLNPRSIFARANATAAAK